jgi:uncharacterized membrane protein YedE/YeeE
MAELQSLLQDHAAGALALAGGVLGLAFGFLAARANFCVMGAISDYRTFASAGRLGAVALATATALILTQGLSAAGLADLDRSMYLAGRFNWAGAVLGGLLFGAGMVYAGGCASRNLIRAGCGDMRALLTVLCLAIAAYATISGVLGPLRALFEDATAAAGALPGSGARYSLNALVELAGADRTTGQAAASAVLAVPLLAFAVLRGGVLSSPMNLFAGLGVGLLVAAGWLMTGLVYDEMTVRPVPPHSLSFVRPVADAIDWLQRSTALGLPGFGAASIFGVLLGSALAARLAGQFRISGFSDAQDIKRHLSGALAMGVGGVMALGCSIGQGITGVSTLSLQSLLAAASIYAGAWLALARLERDA